jgi:hypothetical protein
VQGAQDLGEPLEIGVERRARAFGCSADPAANGERNGCDNQDAFEHGRKVGIPPADMARDCGCGKAAASAPFPKFASHCRTLACELRKHKEHYQRYDSSAPFEPEVRDRVCRRCCADFGFGALAAHTFESERNDLRKALGSAQAGEFGGLDPARLAKLLAEDRLATEPARRDSRMTASVSVSPASTTPPGKVKMLCAGARARRTTRTRPSRMMAALTARNGRSG